MELAIKGHYTRGEEVIKILEMLGGRNVDNLDGNAIYYYYTIMDDKKIIGAAFYLKALDDKFYILSLEEFLEKFPYKVGDKVHNIIHNENQTICLRPRTARYYLRNYDSGRSGLSVPPVAGRDQFLLRTRRCCFGYRFKRYL